MKKKNTKNAEEELDDFLASITAPGVITSATIQTPIEDKNTPPSNSPKVKTKTRISEKSSIGSKKSDIDFPMSIAARVRIDKAILVGLQMAFKNNSNSQEIMNYLGLEYLKNNAPKILEFIKSLSSQNGASK